LGLLRGWLEGEIAPAATREHGQEYEGPLRPLAGRPLVTRISLGLRCAASEMGLFLFRCRLQGHGVLGTRFAHVVRVGWKGPFRLRVTNGPKDQRVLVFGG
jgi:hypothetical protein